jgi:hypothetical protein
MITSGTNLPPSKSARIALCIAGVAAILASICHPSSFLLNMLGLSDARILYIITLAEETRPFLIVIALIALFISYLRIWYPTSSRKSGGVGAITQVKITYKVFFLFVVMLVLIVLILPYFAPCLD